MVDEFLAGQNLKLRDSLLDLPVPPDVAPPPSLSAAAREEWRNFLTFPEHRAFAVSDDGYYGYSFGRSSDKAAQKLAMEHCEDAVPWGDRCQLVAQP